MGDLPLLEFMVGLGASVDYTFHEKFRDPDLCRQSIFIPQNASALLMACVILAIADSTCDRWANARRIVPHAPGTLDRIVECAMQLVRLGADVNRKLNVRDPPYEGVFLIPDMDGKSTFQIAAMSKRRPLVALIWEHMQLSLDDRASIVHCRCGSRLPWKFCHSSGVGQPSHYVSRPDRNCYRVSPFARCPCQFEAKTYYKCCWKDNGSPAYQDDSMAGHCKSASAATDPMMELLNLNNPDDRSRAEFWEAYYRLKVYFDAATAAFGKSPKPFQLVCSTAGPKTRMATWDWLVYAGCLERLDYPTPWSDVHWDLDRPELLKRAQD